MQSYGKLVKAPLQSIQILSHAWRHLMGAGGQLKIDFLGKSLMLLLKQVYLG